MAADQRDIDTRIEGARRRGLRKYGVLQVGTVFGPEIVWRGGNATRPAKEQGGTPGYLAIGDKKIAGVFTSPECIMVITSYLGSVRGPR